MPPSSLSWANIGDEVQVRWSNGRWYDAVVVAERVENLRREISVHYSGWSHSWDEWVRRPARVQRWKSDVQNDIEYDDNAYGISAGREIVNGEVVYDVESIVAVRTSGRQKTEFLVRWVGEYDEEHKQTWEPAANIRDRSLIEDFEHREAVAARAAILAAKMCGSGADSW